MSTRIAKEVLTSLSNSTQFHMYKVEMDREISLAAHITSGIDHHKHVSAKRNTRSTIRFQLPVKETIMYQRLFDTLLHKRINIEGTQCISEDHLVGTYKYSSHSSRTSQH